MVDEAPVHMQDHRLHLHTDMHGNQTEQQSDLQHTSSMQQQCVQDMDHHGQVEGCLQHSAPGEQPSTPSRLQLSPRGLLQGVNQQISAQGKDLQVLSLQGDLHCSGCQDPTNLEAEDPHSGLQKVPAEGKDLHCSSGQDPTNLKAEGPHIGVQKVPEGKDLHCSGGQDPTNLKAEGPHIGVQKVPEGKDLHCSGGQDPTNLKAEGPHIGLQKVPEGKDLHCSGGQDPTNLKAEGPHIGLQKVPAEGKDLHCSGGQDPTNLKAEGPHIGLQKVPAEGKDLHCSGGQDPTNLKAEGPHSGVQDQRNDLQVSSLQKDLYRFGFQGPANPKDPHCELQSQQTLQVSAEGKDLLPLSLQEDLYCLGCQDSTTLGPGDPHGKLQSQLSRLHLEEANVHLVKRQGPQEREPYQPFHHHDVKGHFTDIVYPEPLSAEREPYQPFHHQDVKGYFTDIRYPEPLSTEESPRRRARSLPWNSIPEEDEEDSVMCCCKLKKRVKFADSLGLTLASIKHFLPSDEPLVPQAVLARLQSYPPTARGQRSDLILEDEFRRAELAPSEGTPAELLEKLNEQGVCLEQVSASRLGVLGYVLVKDPKEKAQVKIRYTFNEWLSFLDCPATPTSQSTVLPSTFECQRFHFNLCYPPTTSCIRFAICFNTGNGQEMWDNNKGDNYTVNCQQAVIQEIQQSTPDQEEWEGSRLW